MPSNSTPTCEPPAEPTTPSHITPLDEVIGWLIEGNRDCDIREAIRTKWPDTEPDALQLAAAAHFRAVATCEPEIVVGFAIEAYRDLYRRMVKIGDFAGAGKAIKELTQLLPHVQRFRIEQTDRDQIAAPEADPADAQG